MPRFNVSISFNLQTEIEPDGVYFDDPGTGGIEDFEDASSWYSQDVTSDGGSLRFVVVADSEEEASEKAAEVLSDGQEVEDRNGFTWIVTDLETDLEEIEIPMDAERAKLLVTEYLDSMEGMDDELKLAFAFLLELVVLQKEDIRRAEQRVAQLTGEVERLRPLAETAAGLSGPDAG